MVYSYNGNIQNSSFIGLRRVVPGNFPRPRQNELWLSCVEGTPGVDSRKKVPSTPRGPGHDPALKRNVQGTLS